jgi:5-(carboxyamino)imidazole ribonucleotide mutase
VGVIMGSESDHAVLVHAEQVLRELGIPFEVAVVSAHRTPERMVHYAQTAEARGLAVIIAAAGGAAHLPGMVSALTTVPVLGVPVPSKALAGVDSLLSIVQMPAGVPTATFAIGTAGAVNAALFAAQILAVSNATLRQALAARRDALATAVLEGHARLGDALARSSGSPP